MARTAPHFSPTAVLAGSFAFLAVAVAAFTQLWMHGHLVLDGPGVSLFVRLAVDHWEGLGVPYWLADIWSGTPVWSLAPSFPVLMLVPLASIVGAETAVRLASLAAQVAGGWGTFVLVRSLWRSTPAALLAGLVYALHPLYLSHAFYGHETSLMVMAATPWLVWSLRLGLRGAGPHYVAIAGLAIGFAVLHQAEHVYVLGILCGSILVVELARARLAGTGPRGTKGVLFRAVVVVALGLGVIAHWLVPFYANHESFVLTTPDMVRFLLVEGIAGDLGREMGLFLTRAGEVRGNVGFDRDLLHGNFYLSWVGVLLALGTLPFLRREEDDGCLTAVLFTSAVGVWMSTAAIPLASSGLAERGQLLAFVVVGAVAGMLVGSFIHRLRLDRAAAVGGVVTAVLLVGLPYFAPFLALQRVIPFLASIRFPRFYHVAALGVAMAVGYVLLLVQRWSERRQPSVAPLFTAAVGLAVAGAFLVDIHPYRSFYEVRPPLRETAYQDVEPRLLDLAGGGRVAIGSFGDPDSVTHLLQTGREITTGWPHPVAGRELFRVNGEALFAPAGYRDAALALSGTSLLVEEIVVAPDEDHPQVGEVRLIPNPSVLPMVRAYRRAFVVEDPDLAPVLAAGLAQRNIGVVTGDAGVARRLGPTARTAVPGDPCTAEFEDLTSDVAGEVAAACAIDPWIGVFVELDTVSVRDRPGGVFRARADGLRGIGAWLDRPPHRTQLTLWELAPDGRSLGREVASVVSSGYDDNAIPAFTFDPIPDSAGRSYAFELTCLDPNCENDMPRLSVNHAERDTGNLVRKRERVSNRVANFSLLYDRLSPETPSTAKVEGTRDGPGRWKVRVSGTEPVLVVVAETWFPGWTAEVDGREVETLQADGAFLGVAVEPGDHEITLSHHVGPSVTVGRLITAVTLVASGLLLVVGFRDRRRRRRRRRPASRPPGDALQVGTPPGGPRRKAVLDTAQRKPRRPATARKGPGGEGEQAVLAPVDHLEGRVREQSQQGARREAGQDGHAVPLGMDPPAHPDERVVLHRLRQDEVAPGPEHPADLGQDGDGVVEVVKDVDAPDQGDGTVTEW